jgi:5-methylcytosine-specific restriction enzyme A
MPVRLCSNPACPNPATYRGRCAEHARITNRDTHRNRHIYNSKRWRVLRRWYAFHHPHCATCGTLATDIDHITPIANGGDPWNPAGLQALCAPCHGRKTRREQQPA